MHDLSSQTSETGVRLDLLMKAHREIIETVLPALRAAIENVTDFMYEPEADGEEIHAHLHEWATETVIDELSRLLLHDDIPPSRRLAIVTEDGIEVDTMIAAYDELAPRNVQAWYAYLLGVDLDQYRAWLESIPSHMC